MCVCGSGVGRKTEKELSVRGICPRVKGSTSGVTGRLYGSPHTEARTNRLDRHLRRSGVFRPSEVPVLGPATSTRGKGTESARVGVEK